MDSVTTQKDLADFFKNPDNAREVNGLVEDIRSALIDYQVRAPKDISHVVFDIRCRRRYGWISTMRAANRS